MGCSKTMTVENIKALLDACYQAKRARELLPELGALILQAAYGAVDLHASIFSPDAEVVQKGFEYLKGFAPETIVTAVLFSMVGYFNGNNQTLWVMIQGIVQTLLVRLPLSYYMSIQPNASLTKIGLAAPVSTLVGVLLNTAFYLYFTHSQQKELQKAA